MDVFWGCVLQQLELIPASGMGQFEAIAWQQSDCIIGWAVSRQSDPGSPLQQIAAANRISTPFLAQFICSLDCNGGSSPGLIAVIWITLMALMAAIKLTGLCAGVPIVCD